MKENEYKCYTCDGYGKYYWKYSNGTYLRRNDLTKLELPCRACNESGKINWIENIFRNKKCDNHIVGGPVKISDKDI
jgi:hypothetical protein